VEQTQKSGWAAVGSVAAGSLTLVLSEFLPIGLLTEMGAGLGVSDGVAGLTMMAPGLTGAISAPVLTLAAGKVDRRTILLGMSALFALSNVVAALAPNFTVMLAARMVLGVALGGFWTIGGSIASRLVAERSVASASALVMAGISAGTVVSLPVGALIGQLADWRFAFGAAAVLAIVVLGAQLVLLPRIPVNQVIKLDTLVALTRNKKARAGLVATAFVFAGHFLAYTYLVPYLEDLARVSAGLISTLLLTYGVAGLVGNFVAGATLTRKPLATLVTAIVGMAATVVLLPMVAGSTVGVIALVAFWGLAWGALPLSLQFWMLAAAPVAKEGGLALFVSVIQVSLATGSLVGGLVVDHAGVSPDFTLAALLVALAAAVIWAASASRASTPQDAPPLPSAAASAP
jgi:predicted MFS family arabinose efflux permease